MIIMHSCYSNVLLLPITIINILSIIITIIISSSSSSSISIILFIKQSFMTRTDSMLVSQADGALHVALDPFQFSPASGQGQDKRFLYRRVINPKHSAKTCVMQFKLFRHRVPRLDQVSRQRARCACWESTVSSVKKQEKGGWAKWGMATVTRRSTDVRSVRSFLRTTQLHALFCLTNNTGEWWKRLPILAYPFQGQWGPGKRRGYAGASH